MLIDLNVYFIFC